ncbi:MAG: hypothetical protein AAFZ11_06420 [Pseudomonadota bacterium]
MDPSEAFEARFSPLRALLLGVLGFGFLAVGFWMLGAFGEVPDGSRRVPAWAVPYVGGFIAVWATWLTFAAIANLRNALSGALAARIDPTGVLIPALSQNVIAWRDIGQMRKGNVMGTEFLILEVDDTRSDRFKLQARIRKRLSGGIFREREWPFAVNGTGHSVNEVLEAAREFRPAVSSHRSVEC